MILAIESSCDESAMALFDPSAGLQGEWVHSQIQLHREYGGVVPDLASREHLNAFPLLLAETKIAGWLPRVNAVAVTQGPGLAACLAMGVAVAKSLALARGVPLLAVNHLRGHAFSPFIGIHAADPATFDERMQTHLPHLGAIVSGGNTIVFAMDEQRRIEVLAETVDDAAGEALDKGAKLLGLPYPGGPEIEKRAALGDAKRHDFPASRRSKDDLRFSFSGLKTSLRYRLEAMDSVALEAEMNHLCAGYQRAVVLQLARITERILQRGNGQYRSLGLSGGVANNRMLRDAWQRLGKRFNIPVCIAEPKHTGDNAGMIAFAAYADPAVAPAEGGGLALTVEPSARLA
jgi:N6-L-threonylcarbamoyladenine synthase